MLTKGMAIAGILVVASSMLLGAMSVSVGADTVEGWGSATLIETNDVGSAWYPQVAMDESGNAVAVWAHNDGTWGNLDVWSNRYVVGEGWGTPVVIEGNAGEAEGLQISANPSGNAIAVWIQNDGIRNVWSNRYVVNAGWGAAMLLENDAGEALNPEIAMDASGNAIAVWSQYDGTRYNIWSNRYVVGTGWSGAMLIESDNAGPASWPCVAMEESGNAIAVWGQSDGTRNNIWSNRYVIGEGWGAPVLVETDNAGTAWYPYVAVDESGNAVAVWVQSDGTHRNIWANRYVVGEGWGIASLIETDDAGSGEVYSVAVDQSGNAVTVWRQSDGMRNNIWANRFVVGSGWGTAILIESSDTGEAFYPHVAVDASGNAIAVWSQSDGTVFHIWSNRFVVGEGWKTPVVVETDTAQDAAYSQVAVDPSGNAIAVWDQDDGKNYNIWANRFVATPPDTTPPTTTCSLSGTEGLNGWYVSDVGVTLTATDDVSGVASTSYSTDGGSNWLTYSGAILVSAEGVTAIKYKSADNAGNEESPKSVEFKIDKTAPTTQVTLAGTVSLDGAYVSAVTATLASSDGALSGVDKIYYNLDSGGWFAYISEANINTIGDHQILYYATDLAGNQEAQKSVTFRIEQNLAFDAESTSIVTTNVNAKLVVKVSDDAGNPTEGAEVTFSASPDGLVFGAMPVYTDSSGFASIIAGSGASHVYLVTARTSLGATAVWELVVYDPAGMATGGGWHYPLDGKDDEMPGTASFGFVAKYIKNRPTGNLEYQYHICDKLNFKSTSITWLVVEGADARIRGEGTLNGIPGYIYQVAVSDASEGDSFSIEIWDSDGMLVHSSHNVLCGGNIAVWMRGSVSSVSAAPPFGAGGVFVLSLLAVLTVGLRRIVEGARTYLDSVRSGNIVIARDPSGQRIVNRKRKLSLPATFALIE